MKVLDRAASIDAVLRRVVPDHKRAAVVGEALRNAGTLDIPTEPEPFLAFVEGPLYTAAEHVLGSDVAETIVNELTAEVVAERDPGRTLPFETVPREPHSSPKPAGRDARSETLPYEKKSERRRRDVALIDTDRTAQKAMQQLLEPRRYRVFSVPDENKAAVLCRSLRVSAIIANLEPGGYSKVNTLRHELGVDTPPIVLLGGSDRQKRPRPGVARVAPKVFDDALADTIDAVVDEREG